MKLFIQSIIFSIVAHAIYFGGTLIYGWFLTKQYVPNIIGEYADVTYVQNEVVIGYVISPVYYMISFVLTALLGAVVIRLVHKYRFLRRSV